MAKKNTSKVEALDLLMKTSIEQLREFMRNEFEKNADLWQRFVDFVNEPATKMVAVEKFETDVKSEIEGIIDEAEERYGYIDYHSADYFEDAMLNMLERISEKAPTEELRVSLQLYIARRLDEVTIDDSNGCIVSLIYMILDDFQCIYDNENTREMLFEQCMEHISNNNNNSEENYCKEEIENFVLNFKDEAFAKRIELYLNDKIKALAEETNEWRFQSGTRRYIPKMLQARAAQGVDEKQLMDFAKPLWEYNEVRQFFINRYVKEERFKEAITLLEESLQLDKQWAGLVSDHQKQLKDLYLKTGQKAKHNKMLRTLIDKSWGASIDLFDELKSQYSAEEWATERETIFKMKSGNTSVLAEWFHHEGLTERLTELIFK